MKQPKNQTSRGRSIGRGTRRARMCALACGLCLLGTSTSGLGAGMLQVDPVTRLNRNPQPPATEATRQIGRLIDFEFRGGTFGELIEQLIAASEPVPINIVMPESASRVQVSPMSLRQAAPLAILHAVTLSIPRSEGEMRIQYDDRAIPESDLPGPIPIVTVLYYPPSVSHRSHAAAATPPSAVAPSGPPQIVEVFSLGGFFAEAKAMGIEVSAEDVLGPLELGLSLGHDENRPRPELTFHADSKLLFVRASEEQIRFVNRTLAQLRESIDSSVSTREAKQDPEHMDRLTVLQRTRATHARNLERAIVAILIVRAAPKPTAELQSEEHRLQREMTELHARVTALDEMIVHIHPSAASKWVAANIPRDTTENWLNDFTELLWEWQDVSAFSIRITPRLDSIRVSGEEKAVRAILRMYSAFRRTALGEADVSPPSLEVFPEFR